jgi:Ni,Fe-hydrogenase III large subunit
MTTTSTAAPFEWLPAFLEQFKNESILVQEPPVQPLLPARVLLADFEDWGRIARQAQQAGCRWSAVWADDFGDTLGITACFEKQGDFLLFRTEVDTATPVLPSHTPYYPAADRPERHLQNMFGLVFIDHPDARRWTRHQAWPDSEFPLRKKISAEGNPPDKTPPDDQYPFLQAVGGGIYEIPVGPVHAGIIEPGHFRFQAVGETVLNLEQRLGYVHKGIEKIGEGRDAPGLARLAGRVSGDTTVAHCWAACMAMERAAGLTVPDRALFLRAIMAERERIANHLGDIGAICNDVAFAFAHYQFGRLREQLQRLSHSAFGHRLMMDCVIPGGVRHDLSGVQAQAIVEQGTALRKDLADLIDVMDNNPTLEERLVGTGILQPEFAAAYGALGYVGRASGHGFDLRHDAAYPPYDSFAVHVPVFTQGDVATRLRVRAEEIHRSLDLIAELVGQIPNGRIAVLWQDPAPGAEGIGLVEGWRGEVLTYIRFGKDARIERFFPRDPSWFNWPALEKLVRNNIVPDFPVCNKSVNGSYSGHDL